MQQAPLHKKSLQSILKEAFIYWNKTLRFQIVFTILYFSIIFLFGFYFFKRFGLAEDFEKLTDLFIKNPKSFQKQAEIVALKPEFRNFTIVMVLIKALVFPLNIGFYKIYRKIDLKEKIEFGDLFIGFEGFNFFKFASFGIFWGMIFLYSNSLPPLSVVWVLMTLFSAPLMFFMDKNISECISLTFKALKLYFFEIFVCCMVAFLFSYGGIAFFGFGVLFTFPFWNAIIYSLYQTIFRETK